MLSISSVLHPEQRLWRYMSMDKFIDMLSTQTLYMASTAQFRGTDPFEGQDHPQVNPDLGADDEALLRISTTRCGHRWMWTQRQASAMLRHLSGTSMCSPGCTLSWKRLREA